MVCDGATTHQAGLGFCEDTFGYPEYDLGGRWNGFERLRSFPPGLPPAVRLGVKDRPQNRIDYSETKMLKQDSTTRPTRRSDPPQPHQSRLYDNLVPAYEALWPAVARRRILRNIAKQNIPPGARVLEVGVGTGLSLDAYPRHAEVTGVDLSESMLAEAETKIAKNGWDNIQVQPMNAEELTFDDASFDFVNSFHTVSVVSQPLQMMRELVRVCRPGGKLLVINHFRSDNPLIARFVDSAGGLTRRLGWRTDLDLDELVAELPLDLMESPKRNPLSLFTIMRATRLEGPH